MAESVHDIIEMCIKKLEDRAEKLEDRIEKLEDRIQRSETQMKKSTNDVFSSRNAANVLIILVLAMGIVAFAFCCKKSYKKQ
jgi:hypothetical protein